MTATALMTKPAWSPKERAEARCSACGDEVVEINLVLQSDALTMLSCTPCDTRTWLRDGWPVEIAIVIADVASTSMKYRRDITTG